jgi:hypothetical protein
VIDLLFVAYKRFEFVKASFENLCANTNWALVRNLYIYVDGDTEQPSDVRLWLMTQAPTPPVNTRVRAAQYGGPVAIMNDYLRGHDAPIFGKIDDDTMVPYGWLDACLDVMEKHPKLDLLGIEAFMPVGSSECERGYTAAKHIGGIGLMRRSAFDKEKPRARGRMGFTEFQHEHPEIQKGWINPALPVFLLDRLPLEPWASLSREYVKKGWQRPWPGYSAEHEHLWAWWADKVTA